MTSRLLIVEDDLALRTGLSDSFEGEGFEVTCAADGCADPVKLQRLSVGSEWDTSTTMPVMLS